MNYKIIPSANFMKEARRLANKYSSLKEDLTLFRNELKENPLMGKPLGKDCYKIPWAIKSKSKGKSGGARIITCVKVIKEHIHVLTIYDKSEKENITDIEIEELLKQIEPLL